MAFRKVKDGLLESRRTAVCKHLHADCAAIGLCRSVSTPSWEVKTGINCSRFMNR